MLLLGQVHPDCDWNDKKLDKRRLGCRERAQFVLGVKEKGVEKAYEEHKLHACRSHVKDMMHKVLGPVVGAMRLINPNIVLFCHDIDLANQLRRQKGLLDKARADAVSKRQEEFAKTGKYPPIFLDDPLAPPAIVPNSALCSDEACPHYGKKHYH